MRAKCCVNQPELELKFVVTSLKKIIELALQAETSNIHVPVDIKSSQASRDETSGLQGRPDIHVGHECLSILNEVNGYEIGYQILNKII